MDDTLLLTSKSAVDTEATPISSNISSITPKKSLHPIGLSTEGFLAVIEAAGGRKALISKSTQQFKQDFVLTYTASSAKAFADILRLREDY